jgi:hypothetical protein
LAVITLPLRGSIIDNSLYVGDYINALSVKQGEFWYNVIDCFYPLNLPT